MAESRKKQIEIWLKEKPKDPFLNYALAIELIAEGNDLEAEKIFFSLVQAHPNYHATYYHYGQLLERKNDDDKAAIIYEQGMKICTELNEKHAFGELRSVYEELTF